jgi:hypothetical protein
MVPKPHISQAIKGLRRWVVLCAAVVALAAVTQATIFGFVHYTDVRETRVQAAPPKELRVIDHHTQTAAPSTPYSTPPSAADARAKGNAAPLLGPGSLMDTQANVVGGVRAGLLAEAPSVDPNLVKSSTDGYLRQTSTMACGVGSIASVVLCMLVFMGTIIAGGGAIPGVEKAVTASFWSMVLAALVLPWKDFMPSAPVPGIFSTYDGLVAASESARAGGGSALLFAKWLVLPMLAAVASTLVASWFHAGVRRGVILTSVTELDRQVEREVALIAKRGVANTAPRTLGALNRAIGDSADETLASLDHAAGMAASLVRETRPTVTEPTLERSAAGRHPGRLI